MFGSFLKRLGADARHYQIFCLFCLLTAGVGWLEFDIRPANAIATIATALATQCFFTWWFRVPSFDARSPFISSLSLCLLLRTDMVPVAALAAFVTIASKFLIRRHGKHVFNPTNFGIVCVIILTDRAWVSSGQWGSGAWTVFLLACLGGLVANRARRNDISLAVLSFYAAVLFGRAFWLGDPLSIPVHQLQNGALLIFAFFMISDPKTTPDSRPARLVFAAAVTAIAGWIQFGLFEPNGLLYALAAAAPATPLLDRVLPGERFEWKQKQDRRVLKLKGTSHEPQIQPHTGGVRLPDTAC